MDFFARSGTLLKRIALSLCLSAILTLTGCFDTRQEFTLNPDGSGKVVHECRFDDLGSIWKNSIDSEKSLQGSIRRLIEESKGVDLWRDVKFLRMEDGRRVPVPESLAEASGFKLEQVANKNVTIRGVAKETSVGKGNKKTTQITFTKLLAIKPAIK